MRWTWDPNKAAANLKKHKVSFGVAERVFDDPPSRTLIRIPTRNGGKRSADPAQTNRSCFSLSILGPTTRTLKGAS
jgi:uncharacterized DUF497 family protein